MIHGFKLKLLSLGCAAGVLSGMLLVDGTFINFRGEDVRRAIEELANRDPMD